MVTKIVSGGQTGADQAALSVARSLGIATGGTAPKGWRTEDGPSPGLKSFGLVESYSSGYWVRTIANVRDSDGTVVFGEKSSAGSHATIDACKEGGKPFIVNPTGDELRAWCEVNDISVLNVAGNRLSINPKIHEQVESVLVAAFGGPNG